MSIKLERSRAIKHKIRGKLQPREMKAQAVFCNTGVQRAAICCPKLFWGLIPPRCSWSSRRNGTNNCPPTDAVELVLPELEQQSPQFTEIHTFDHSTYSTSSSLQVFGYKWIWIREGILNIDIRRQARSSSAL